MLRLKYQYSYSKGYIVKGDLDNLLRRLKKGMQLRGRIVDCLGENKYLLRIWGYNILTESKQSFQRQDEILLIVREVEPRLILDLIPDKQSRGNGVNTNRYQTNILVH